MVYGYINYDNFSFTMKAVYLCGMFLPKLFVKGVRKFVVDLPVAIWQNSKELYNRIFRKKGRGGGIPLPATTPGPSGLETIFSSGVNLSACSSTGRVSLRQIFPPTTFDVFVNQETDE